VIVLADCCESVTDEMHQFSITQILPAMAEVVDAADFIEWASALTPDTVGRQHG
jgi:nicotinamidase-related amidase